MDGLKPLFGGLLKHPIPLELSGNFCSHKCSYCYANLNAPTRTMDVKSVQNLLAKYQDRNSLEAMLLRDGYPVMTSNHIDPFSASNYRQMIPFMETMTELGIGYSPQTKGGKGWEKVLEFMPKGVWYITISHDTEETRQLIEPAAPSLEHRYELIAELVKLGHTVLVGTNPCESEWLKDPIAYFENLKEIGVYGVWLEQLHLNVKQRAAMPDRDAARLGNLAKDCLKKKKNPDRLNFLLECRAIAQSVGLEINSVGQGNYSLFFEPYKELYNAAFPTTQDMINHCAFEQKEFITYREWVELLAPNFPNFVTASNYHYVDSNARMSPELTLGFKAPKNPSFETILKCILRAEKLPNHPCHSLAFSFAVDKDEKRWLDDDGCPVLCFNDGGWTHEMIIYDKHPLNG